nr:putative Gag-polypeptide of LTR copia-type [Tanacetum cinerariifolium]
MDSQESQGWKYLLNIDDSGLQLLAPLSFSQTQEMDNVEEKTTRIRILGPAGIFQTDSIRKLRSFKDDPTQDYIRKRNFDDPIESYSRGSREEAEKMELDGWKKCPVSYRNIELFPRKAQRKHRLVLYMGQRLSYPSAHHIPHNLFKSSNQATMSGEATKSGDDLSLRLTNLLKNGFNNQPQNLKVSDNLQINLKLNNQNYTLWTRMIRDAMGGKSKALLSHLTSDPPEQSSETYEQWGQEDLIVFSWLIQNIKPTLAGNLTKYHTAKTLWDALVITYNSERDKLQTFDIHVKANDIKQNKTHLKYGNCGMTRHTTEQCFELIGYPDWWNDGHKKGNKNQGPKRGKASAVNTDTDRKSHTGFEGMATTTINEEDGSFSMSTTQNYNINQKQSWIFDCEATNTMTYDLSDFATSTKPTKSYIHTTNREKINDIRTGVIIGRGTERQGLYYVDEVTRSGTVMLSHGTAEREA